MKKIFIIAIFALFSFTGFTQQTNEATNQTQSKNELHLNMFTPIAFKSFELSYEYLVNKDNGLGLSVFVGNGDFMEINYIVSPFYRRYFSNKHASGFFLETFLGINSGTDEMYYEYLNPNTGYYDYEYKSEKYTDLAFGVGTGYKFLSNDRFVGMVSLGIARNLFNEHNDVEIIGKGGIYFGYRF